MPDSPIRSPSRLLNYLPPVYQSDFLGQFLLAFEDILLGSGTSDFQGLEESIANTASLFDPHNPNLNEEFLTWLATWTAFSLRADLSLTQQRDFIAKIIPLYQRRGTKENLIELLKIFTIGEPRIQEAAEGLQVGIRSTVGEDTFLGSDLPPHFFAVTISLPTIDPNQLGRQIEITKALIELEKPAHTFYRLDVTPGFPTLQIGEHSTVGVDTILGTAPT